MALPFFYTEEIHADPALLMLNEETSRHIVQVLRMQEGEQLNLTNGKGEIITTEIIEAHKKKCTVKKISSISKPVPKRKISIAISLLKNAGRFEWFLEKATEIGVAEIIPLICDRTEKQHFRYDRMHGILISAMLQSQQCWLPQLHEPVKFEKFISRKSNGQKFIAHCLEHERRKLSELVNGAGAARLICIGPEGDFSHAEINLALENHFLAVELGETRLRTETAGVVAAALLVQ